MATTTIGAHGRTTGNKRASIVFLGAVLWVTALLFPNAKAVVGRVLTSDEQTKLEASALVGDGKAAGQLAEHYYLLDKRSEGEYWNRIAIENGDPYTLWAYASRLWQSGGSWNCRRAVYLYDKILTPPVEFPPELLNELQGQHAEMKKDLEKCVAKACSREVEGAWCP